MTSRKARLRICSQLGTTSQRFATSAEYACQGASHTPFTVPCTTARLGVHQACAPTPRPHPAPHSTAAALLPMTLENVNYLLPALRPQAPVMGPVLDPTPASCYCPCLPTSRWVRGLETTWTPNLVCALPIVLVLSEPGGHWIPRHQCDVCRMLLPGHVVQNSLYPVQTLGLRLASLLGIMLSLLFFN